MRFRNSAVDPSRVGSTIFFLLVAFFATESFSQTAQPVPEHPTANQAQGQSDLSEAAERARMERDRERARRSSNSEAVNEMAGELEDSTQPDPRGAPVGFRFYNFKEGNYSILVPADAEIQGRDQYGLKLLSSDAMGSRTVVMLGQPIPAEGDTPEHILRNAFSAYFPGCRMGGGLGEPVNGHPTAKAGFSMCSLNREVSGYAEFILGDGYVMPLICGYPFLPEDLDPNANLHLPLAALEKKYDRQRNGFRACDVIFPSLRFNERSSNWQPKKTLNSPPKAAVTNALLNQTAPNDSGADEASLGNVARRQKRVAVKEAVEEIKHEAPGFDQFAFNYCGKQECFEASLLIPVKARKDEQFRMDVVGLFEFEVPIANSVAVIEARMGAPSDPAFLTREQFINSKVNWWIDNTPAGYYSPPGKAEVFSEELTTYNGMPVRTTTFRTVTRLLPVVTQQVAYMAPGKFVQIRCSAPENIYADAQAMCEQVVRSLEVPKARLQGQELERDDP